jgi:hypothetical protein
MNQQLVCIMKMCEKLIEILQKLVDKGNTVMVIEHNMDLIKSADYIIDIGPEGGVGGGKIVAKGTPEEVANNPKSYTGKYLKKVSRRVGDVRLDWHSYPVRLGRRRCRLLHDSLLLRRLRRRQRALFPGSTFGRIGVTGRRRLFG